MLPGVHKVRGKLAGGELVEYWYAWRGGPRILSARARSDSELEDHVAAAAAKAAAGFVDLVTPKVDTAFLAGLIARYLSSPEHARKSVRRRTDLGHHLDAAKADLGDMPIEALRADGARKALIDWRDGEGHHPCTADSRLGGLAVVFGWAKGRGEIPINPLEKWPRIYKSNRAELIWTKPDLVQLLKGAPADFRRAVLLASFTSLRLADLARLTWAEVGDKAITHATGKSGGKRVALIPITPKAAAVLRQIGRKDVGAVLTHSKGAPWTGWGLQTAMQRAKTAAGIKGLTFHDLRGTACTNFVRAGLPLADVATIMGWAPDRVEAIARRYVTAEAVAEGMLERLRKNRRGA